jgi:hypothetical protein
MFIDIQWFSDCASNLTPQQIMGNLSLILGAFDTVRGKYQQVIKINLLGDLLMCAAGLCTQDDPTITHAEQMITFALDCLLELDDINIQLDANLMIRIGINTGGPIPAGVLRIDNSRCRGILNQIRFLLNPKSFSDAQS